MPFVAPLLFNEYPTVNNFSTGADIYREDAQGIIYRLGSNFRYSFTPGTTISVWFRRAENDSNGCIIGNDQIYGENGRFMVYAGTNSVTLHANNLNQIVVLTWPCQSDSLWHHILIRIDQWSGAFPGLFSARMWFDGRPLGTRSATGPNTYGVRTVISKYLGIGRAVKQFYAGGGLSGLNIPSDHQVTPMTRNPNEGQYVGQPTNVFPWYHHFDGCISQVWINTMSDATFDPTDYYYFGPVDFGSQGRNLRTRTLATNPTIYNKLDYPFDWSITYVSDTTAQTINPIPRPFVGNTGDPYYLESQTQDTDSGFACGVPVRNEPNEGIIVMGNWSSNLLPNNLAINGVVDGEYSDTDSFFAVIDATGSQPYVELDAGNYRVEYFGEYYAINYTANQSALTFDVKIKTQLDSEGTSELVDLGTLYTAPGSAGQGPRYRRQYFEGSYDFTASGTEKICFSATRNNQTLYGTAIFRFTRIS